MFRNCVHTFWTIRSCDVAETAFRGARNLRGRVGCRHSVNELDEAVDEALVHSTSCHALDAVRVVDLARDSGVPVLLHRSRQRVHVDHHLGDVRGALGAGLGVHDEDVVVAGGDDQVGLAREGGDAALEPEGVLAIHVDSMAAILELSLGVGQ